MARQGRARPKGKARDLETQLLESAESLGRIIGSLQKELDDLGRPGSSPYDRRAPAPSKRASARPSKGGSRKRVATAPRNTKGATGTKGTARSTAKTARSGTGGNRGGRKAARRARSR